MEQLVGTKLRIKEMATTVRLPPSPLNLMVNFLLFVSMVYLSGFLDFFVFRLRRNNGTE